MELLLVMAVLGAFALAASLKGWDSRPSLDDEPHRTL